MSRVAIPASTVVPALAMAALLVTACRTTPSATSPPAASSATPQMQRAAEQHSDYETQSPIIQKQLAEGIISRGQSLQLVYIALGRPDTIVTTPNARTITWTYKNYLPPVTSANKVIIGHEDMSFVASGSPLYDFFESWRHKATKAETMADPELIARAPTQSWRDYGKYLRDRSMAGSKAAKDAIDLRAKLEYQEAVTRQPMYSPDTVVLDVIFIDQFVVDVTANSTSVLRFHSDAISATP